MRGAMLSTVPEDPVRHIAHLRADLIQIYR